MQTCRMRRSVGNYSKKSLGMYRKILLLGCLLPFLASCYNDLYNVSATYEVELFGNASIKEFDRLALIDESIIRHLILNVEK